MAMPLTRGSYQSETDFRLLLAWLGRHSQHAFMYPGDLTWWLRQNEAVDPLQALDPFFLEPEELGGFVFSDPVIWAVLQGREDLPPAAWAQMIHAVETKAGQPVTFNTYTAAGRHSPRVDALERAGYRPTPNRLTRLQQVLTPAHLDPALLPAGYRFTDMDSLDNKPWPLGTSMSLSSNAWLLWARCWRSVQNCSGALPAREASPKRGQYYFGAKDGVARVDHSIFDIFPLSKSSNCLTSDSVSQRLCASTKNLRPLSSGYL